MTAKSTPGPWSVFSIYAETEIRGPQDSGAMIARMVPWGDAAPDMLAACEAYLADRAEAGCTADSAAVKAMRAAVAKATGAAS